MLSYKTKLKINYKCFPDGNLSNNENVPEEATADLLPDTTVEQAKCVSARGYNKESLLVHGKITTSPKTHYTSQMKPTHGTSKHGQKSSRKQHPNFKQKAPLLKKFYYNTAHTTGEDGSKVFNVSAVNILSKMLQLTRKQVKAWANNYNMKLRKMKQRKLNDKM